MIFKVGDTVLIRKNSRFYSEDDEWNPYVPGVVIGVYETGHLRVGFTERISNSYREKDLNKLIKIKGEVG